MMEEFGSGSVKDNSVLPHKDYTVFSPPPRKPILVDSRPWQYGEINIKKQSASAVLRRAPVEASTEHQEASERHQRQPKDRLLVF